MSPAEPLKVQMLKPWRGLQRRHTAGDHGQQQCRRPQYIVFGDAGFDMAMQEDKPSDDTVALDGAGMQLTHIASGVADSSLQCQAWVQAFSARSMGRSWS